MSKPDLTIKDLLEMYKRLDSMEMKKYLVKYVNYLGDELGCISDDRLYYIADNHKSIFIRKYYDWEIEIPIKSTCYYLSTLGEVL